MTQRRIYQCAFPYFVTFNSHEGEWIFEDRKRAELLHRLILECGIMKDHLVYQFSIMPDHVHLLCKTEPCSTQKNTARASVPAMDFKANNDNGCLHEKWHELPEVNRGQTDYGDMNQIANTASNQIAGAEARALIGRNKSMPNIADFMHSLKSLFVYRMRKEFGYEQKFLQSRYNFRIVDSEKYPHHVINYIANNPIAADLPKRYQKYPYQYYDGALISGLF